MLFKFCTASYICVCSIIYTGVRCEIPVNPCLLNGSCTYTSSSPNEFSTSSGKNNKYVDGTRPI